MDLVGKLAATLLLFAAAVAGILDAAKSGLIDRGAAALLILGSLLTMIVCVGAASSNHRSLVINTLLAATSVIVSHVVLASLVKA